MLSPNVKKILGDMAKRLEKSLDDPASSDADCVEYCRQMLDLAKSEADEHVARQMQEITR